jgi:AhpD family alkylhydroperoxidase
MRIIQKACAYAVIATRARRNRFDLLSRLARRPTIAIGVGTYEAGLFVSSRLDTRTKQLASAKAASMIGCQFCLDIGSALSSAMGITERDLLDLRRYRESEAFTEQERLAIEFAEAMTATPVALTDSLVEQVRATFTSAEIVELVAEVAWENHRARLNQALGVRPMGFSDGSFCMRSEA